MSFYNFKVLTGTAVALLACLAIAHPSTARPLAQQTDMLLLSQVNQPETEGVPQLTIDQVQGRITKIDGDKVELRLSNGETRSYTISKADQDRNRLAVGSDVVLNVQGDRVVAVNPDPATSGAAGEASSSTGSSSSATSSTSSSTTVIRRETTVQQTQPTRPAPAPAPSPAPAAAPQPVRGLW